MGGQAGATGLGGAGLVPVDDPGCPNATAPTVIANCDPFATATGCQTGDGCYPGVVYPTEPCESERYLLLCSGEGSGNQWDDCSQSNDCVSGHACVITGIGTQCLALCRLDSADDCPEGLLCDSIDFQGIGACL